MMKKILIQTVVFAAILLLADRIGTYFFDRYIFSRTLSGESGGSVNYLLEKKRQVKLLVMGSSRAKHHIDPSRLSGYQPADIYNAGINGTGGLIYNDRLLQILLEKGIKPEKIILQLDAWPYFTMPDDKAVIELAQLYPFIADSHSLAEYMKKHGGMAESVKLFFHSYRFNGKLLNILYNYRKRNQAMDTNGFAALEGILKDSLVKPLPADACDTSRFDAIKMDALRHIAASCRKHNIILEVVFPPSYNNTLFTKTGNDKLKALLKEEGISRVIDFSAIGSIPALSSAEYWRDATHLNGRGARIFSDSLNARINEKPAP